MNDEFWLEPMGWRAVVVLVVIGGLAILGLSMGVVAVFEAGRATCEQEADQ